MANSTMLNLEYSYFTMHLTTGPDTCVDIGISNQ